MGLETSVRRLLTWYGKHRRDLPWRRTSDPYRIWVSEIMLQQTRVSTVIPYYERFLEQFPDVAALASAPEEELLAAWSGLGYYSRARNLRKAAGQVVARGGFPNDYEGIRSLSGIGDYTAAAIASIAFGLPRAAVDGNVLRVMSRIGNDSGEITESATRSRLRDRAQSLLDRKHPGDFNQALMELGATVCLPRNPQCPICPLRTSCAACEAGTQDSLPVKRRRQEILRVSGTAVLVEKQGRLLLRRRPADSATLAGFWELPEVGELPAATPVAEAGEFRHSITNHIYTFQVFTAAARRAPRGFQWIEFSRLANLPLSTVARKALACAPPAGPNRHNIEE